MTLVVDASVSVKWVVPEEMSDVALEIYGCGERLVAPRLLVTEVANALVRKTSQGQMKPDRASQSFSALKGYRLELVDVDELIEPSLKNACAFRHPIYDFIYLEVARRFDARLITADRRFAAKLAGTDLARHVTLLSDWQPE